VEQGSKFAVFANGFFCDRLTEMSKRQGAEVVRMEKPWGEVFDDREAADFIGHEKPQVVAFVHAETSTGALQNPKAICDAAHDAGALVIADTVTSLGAVPVNVDENGIDVAYSCTQKGLSCPPGLSPITVSPRALHRLKARKTPVREWYLDLNLLREYYDGRKYHHTASATMFYGLCEALRAIMDEGLEGRFERHVRAHKALVKGLADLGLDMHVAEGHRIPNLNTPRVPAGVDDAKVRKHLLEKHGIEIAGGFGQLAGKIFRVGLMGPLATESGVEMFLGAFKDALGA
jgi:alanine-glyoxylate transaminase/serine-glyoxylate transaminase/serine-pyruvate transaminase